MGAHFLSGKKVVIAGAGMAGLSFALALRKQWPADVEPPQITIYDRDTKVRATGREGYSLSLAGHDQTGGLVVLRDLGLLDKVLPHSLLGMGDGGSFKVWDSSWREIMGVKYKPYSGLPTSGIRIARKELRNALIDALGPDDIRWDVACVSAERLPSGRVQVQLAGGGMGPGEATRTECDLLVAADGASSKIRACLRPHDTLQYAGAIQLGGISRFPDGIPEPVDKNWGLLMSPGQGVCCFISPCDATGVVWAISHLSPTPAVAVNRDDPHELEAIREEGKRLGSMFAEPFRTIVDATQPEELFRMGARDKQPFANDLGPIVFLGDSNHAVSPFAGYGANLALKDGWDLAQQICKAPALDVAVRAYDAVSLPRATKILDSSHWRIDMGHSTGLKFAFFRVVLGFGGLMLRILGKS